MQNLNEQNSRSFAEKWISAWNSHDMDRILSHYSEDFIIESRIALKVFPETGGRIIGKEAVKEYWTLGLSRNKDLHFKLLDVLFGTTGLTIYYVNVANKLRAVEVLLFNKAGKVCQAFVHHSE